MKKIVGYLLMVLGLAFIIARPVLAKINILKNLPFSVFVVIGFAFIAVGFALTLGKKKDNEEEELPIYEGEKVIGYRRKSQKGKK